MHITVIHQYSLKIAQTAKRKWIFSNIQYNLLVFSSKVEKLSSFSDCTFLFALPNPPVTLARATLLYTRRACVKGLKARQIVKPSATLLLINSIGDKYPKHLRGLLLIKEITESNCSCGRFRKSVPLGKKKRIKPLMFSLLPLCQGEWESAK